MSVFGSKAKYSLGAEVFRFGPTTDIARHDRHAGPNGSAVNNFPDHFIEIGGSCVHHIVRAGFLITDCGLVALAHRQIVEADQSDMTGPNPLQKDFLFFGNIRLRPDPNHFHIPAIPLHTEGRCATSSNAERGAVDADAPVDDRRGGVWQNRMVLMPRRWHQVRARSCGL
jgi:hypothetical protein